MLKKVMNIHEEKEQISKQKKIELENLIKQVNSLKEKFYKINNNINNEEIDIDKNDINKFVKDNIEEYNISADESKIDDDLSEEKENNEEDADDMLDNTKSKNLKIQLEKLTQEYYKMKNECKEYEKIISEYKEKYKNVEGKINEIKKSIEI